jgi:hypothetical protein
MQLAHLLLIMVITCIFAEIIISQTGQQTDASIKKYNIMLKTVKTLRCEFEGK